MVIRQVQDVLEAGQATMAGESQPAADSDVQPVALASVATASGDRVEATGAKKEAQLALVSSDGVPVSTHEQNFEEVSIDYDGSAELSQRGRAWTEDEEDVTVPTKRNKTIPALLMEVELHLLYGQNDEAILTLRNLIDDDDPDDPDILPWNKLFEVYRDTGDRQAFDELVEQFVRHYNVAPPQWAQVIDTEDQGLESRYPWVMQEIEQLWGKKGCLSLLNSLVVDDRNGDRQGFAIQAAAEISLLKELLIAKLEMK